MNTPACNMPWIDTVVTKYVDNIPQSYSQVDALLCCVTPGNCSVNPVEVKCPLGYLDCNFGNSRYSCIFMPTANQDPLRCWSEGTLTHTRNVPCCASTLTGYMKTQTCIGGFSDNTSYCCSNNTVGSCSTQIGCPGLPSEGQRQYYCIGGATTAICKGYGLITNEKCAIEVSLVKEVSPGCMSMTFPSSGCALGGSGPALPSPSAATPSVSTTLPSTTTGVLPKSAGGKTVVKKWLAVCLTAPALLQLVFL